MNFSVKEIEVIKDIVPEWEISDKFMESDLDNLEQLPDLITSRKWLMTVPIEENNAVNISWAVSRYQGEGDTVFAKIVINAKSEQIKRFEFGYSDRVVAILSGQAIYRCTNGWRIRDYRYLGTVGLFDSIYLNLKKGKNVLLMAVSEDFGGWGITGKFVDNQNISISH